jgi:hypothetical protein
MAAGVEGGGTPSAVSRCIRSWKSEDWRNIDFRPRSHTPPWKQCFESYPQPANAGITRSDSDLLRTNSQACGRLCSKTLFQTVAVD